jgi:hypothetical protein
MAKTSKSVVKYLGSMIGLSNGFADLILIVPPKVEFSQLLLKRDEKELAYWKLG